MRNEFFRILLVGLVLFCLIGSVSASENMTETQLMDEENAGYLNDDESLSVSDYELVKDGEKHTDMYVNTRMESGEKAD